MKIQTSKSLTSLLRFLEKEDGPTAVEYAIMLALIFGVIILSVRVLGDNTNDSYEGIRDEVSTVISETTGG